MFLTHPNSHTVTASMTFSLYCNVSGFNISYGWDMISTNGGHWSRIRSSNSYKYDVRNIQQSKQYRCIAGNDAGTFVSNAATIQILSKLMDLNNICLLLLVIEVISHPHNKQTLIGLNFILTCISSVSSNVFLWTHNGTIIKTQSSVNDNTSRLPISNVRYSDGGSYVCIVRSGSLSVTSNTATVTVYGKIK